MKTKMWKRIVKKFKVNMTSILTGLMVNDSDRYTHIINPKKIVCYPSEFFFLFWLMSKTTFHHPINPLWVKSSPALNVSLVNIMLHSEICHITEVKCIAC